MSVYPFIEAEKAGRRNVKRACALLKVSRAAFYAHLSGPSRREREDAELTGQIQAVHEESKGRYGARLRGTLLLTAGVAFAGLALTLVLPEPAGRSLEDMPTSTRDERAIPGRLASQPTEDPASAA